MLNMSSRFLAAYTVFPSFLFLRLAIFLAGISGYQKSYNPRIRRQILYVHLCGPPIRHPQQNPSAAEGRPLEHSGSAGCRLCGVPQSLQRAVVKWVAVRPSRLAAVPRLTWAAGTGAWPNR